MQSQTHKMNYSNIQSCGTWRRGCVEGRACILFAKRRLMCECWRGWTAHRTHRLQGDLSSWVSTSNSIKEERTLIFTLKDVCSRCSSSRSGNPAVSVMLHRCADVRQDSIGQHGECKCDSATEDFLETWLCLIAWMHIFNKPYKSFLVFTF